MPQPLAVRRVAPAAALTAVLLAAGALGGCAGDSEEPAAETRRL